MKISYSTRTYGYLKQEIKPDVLKAVQSAPELRKEIAKVFQKANRRIQNIESKDLLSPAVKALGKNVSGFTKFSMKQDWDALKVDYAKAISFLRQPTSTATGTREYNNFLKQTYELTDNEFDLMAQKLNDKLTSVSDEEFVERYLMQYKDFTGELEQSAQDISTQLESEGQSIAKALDDDIEKAADKAAENISNRIEDDINKKIEDIFSKFNM